MADKRCENGHFIDEAWDICPYCPQDANEPEIPVVRPRSIEAPARSAHAAAGGATGPQPALSRAEGPAEAPGGMRAPFDSAQGRHRPTMASPPAPVLIQPPPQERTVAAARLDHTAGAQKRYVVGWLVGLNASARGESFPVRMGRNVIGRDRRSDIFINDDQASSHHADLVFRPEERRFILMDHNSTNGTYVNEAEIEPRRDLIEKDVVRIGSHRLLFLPLCRDGFYWDDEGLLK